MEHLEFFVAGCITGCTFSVSLAIAVASRVVKATTLSEKRYLDAVQEKVKAVRRGERDGA